MTSIEVAHEYTQLNFISGELKGLVNMRFFDIPPLGFTRAVRIISPNLVSTRIVTFGDGWFIGINPESKFIRMNLQMGNQMKRSVVLSQEWVHCFFAGPHGLKIMDVSRVPFQPDMEEPYIPDKSPVSQRFLTFFKFQKSRMY